MRNLTTMGPVVRVDIGPDKFYGQLKDGFLFMETGTISVPEDAIITPMEITAPLLPNFKLETKGAKTPYEKWQMEIYGDYVKEDATAETHDDLKQWHNE